MTAFVAIPNGDIDQDSPVTQELMTALRDNLLSVVEDDASAPKIKAKVAGASGTTITFTGMDNYSGAVVDLFYVGTTSTASHSLAVSFSDDGTTFYGSTTLYSDGTSGKQWGGQFWINFATGAYGFARGSHSGASAGVYSSGTIAGASNAIKSIRFVNSGGLSITAVIQPNGGLS